LNCDESGLQSNGQVGSPEISKPVNQLAHCVQVERRLHPLSDVM
jgi:hypothetical protein